MIRYADEQRVGREPAQVCEHAVIAGRVGRQDQRDVREHRDDRDKGHGSSASAAPRVAQRLDGILSQAARAEPTYLDFLDQILAEETDAKQKKRVAMGIQIAHFPTVKTLDDFGAIPLATSESGTPVTLKDVARIQIGPEMRRGIAELDGQGETVGGIVVMRHGRNALEVIDAALPIVDVLAWVAGQGIETRIFSAGNLGLHPFWADRYGLASFPVADRIHHCGFFLPNHASMDEGDVAHIARVVLEAA